MKKTANKWILLVILGLVIHTAANFSDYKLVFQENNFLVEAIYQLLESDLDNDQKGEALITGKNYLGRELFIYWLGFDPDHKPVVKWQSPNLFEEQSLIWIASGSFSTTQNQLLALSNSQYYLYQYQNNSLNLIKQDKHNLQPLRINGSVSCGDLNGDGQSELVIAKIGEVNSKFYNSRIQVWQYIEGQFKLLTESGLLENIRGLTVGDLDGDGKGEIIVEEGVRTDPGDLHVLKLADGKLAERFCLKNAVKGAVYSMQVKAFPEGIRLVTASDRGKVNLFAWNNNALGAVAKELVFNSALVAITTVSTDQTQPPLLLLAGYPQKLMILTR